MGIILLLTLFFIVIILFRLRVGLEKKKEGWFIYYTITSNFEYRQRYMKQITKTK